MESLFAVLREDAAVRKLRAQLMGESAETLAYGLGGSLKHAVVAARCDVAQPVVIVGHDLQALTAWRTDLEGLLPDVPVLPLPELAVLDVQAAASGMERSAQRMEVLGRFVRQEPCIVLATADAAVQQGMSRTDFER